MSQPPNATDTQALLQSMLQRLRIQQGKESESHVPNSAVSTCAEEEVTEASSVQKLHNGPAADGYDFGTNGIPSKVFRVSEAEQSLNLKGEVTQKNVFSWEVDKDHISFPAKKDKSDGGTDQSRTVGQDTQPRVPPAQTGPLIPAELSKYGAVTSYTSNVETLNNGGMSQSFQPKVFAWSSSPTHVAGSPRYRVLPVENGEFGFTPSNETLITPTNQNIERGGYNRKQQTTGKKPRRWTQRIKDRWKDRPGSFGKKHKEEQRQAQQIGQQTEVSVRCYS